MDDFADLLGGIAETFGLGEVVQSLVRGPEAYAQSRSTQTEASGEVPYVYERVLTRPRALNVNDR